MSLSVSLSVSHQRAIRDKMSLIEPRHTVPLEGCYVDLISRDTAKSIILKYEWLGTIGKAQHCVGLFSPHEELLGALCFGSAPGTNSHNICGPQYKHLAICLERGACVHYAHPHSGSFLVSRACRLLSKHTPYRIFFAYSDAEAGEIGTIYQACNWIYLGIAPGRNTTYRNVVFDTHTGKVIHQRQLRVAGKTMADARADPRYEIRKHNDKGKYVWFEGSKTEKAHYRKLMKHPPVPYPKRATERAT